LARGPPGGTFARVTRAVSVLAVVLSLAAAAAAALIVAPAPSKPLALLAMVAGEKSLLVVAAALLAAILAAVALLAGGASGARAAPAVALALSAGAIALGLLPTVQAVRLAAARQVRLDLRRYLGAPIDTEGPGQPDRTVTYLDVDGRRLALDVYVPRARPAAPGRAILVVHGGFWAAGDKGEASLFSRWLAGRGFTVFDVEYRTAPQPNWKTATGDVKCAVAWVKRHASTADWNVDPRKLALLGRSAGGHLALMAAYTPGDPALPPSCPSGDGGGDGGGDGSVDAVVALYAPTDLAWGYTHPANGRVADSPAKLRAFLGGTPESAGDRYRTLSPTQRATGASARTLLVQGGRDQFLRPEHMQRLADRLRAAGVPHETLFIPYAQHAFDFVVGGFSGQIMEAALLRFLDG
jgi:acetyl esterase/lipase